MGDKKDDKTAELPLPAPAPEPTPLRRGRGRPRQYANAAERQRAYRERLRERGMRTITRVVRDVRDVHDDRPLTSDVIDLSEVRRRTGGGSS